MPPLTAFQFTDILGVLKLHTFGLQIKGILIYIRNHSSVGVFCGIIPTKIVQGEGFLTNTSKNQGGYHDITAIKIHRNCG